MKALPKGEWLTDIGDSITMYRPLLDMMLKAGQ